MTAEESRRRRGLLDIEMNNWISTPDVPRPAYIDPYGFPEGSGFIRDLPDADYLPRAHPSTSTEARAPDASDSPPGESPFADPTEPPQLDTEARLKEQNIFVSDDQNPGPDTSKSSPGKGPFTDPEDPHRGPLPYDNDADSIASLGRTVSLYSPL
jgi:hypothetical protein